MEIEGYEDHCVRELQGEGVAACWGCGMGRFWCGGLRFGWVAVWGSWALRWVLCGDCRVVVGLWGGCSVGRMRCEGVAVGELRCGGVAVWRSSCGELQQAGVVVWGVLVWGDVVMGSCSVGICFVEELHCGSVAV